MKAYDKTCPKCSGQMEIDYVRAMLVCPYCGNEMILEPEMMQAPIEPPKAPAPEVKSTRFGLFAMIAGIASFLTCGMLFLPEIAALVLAILSFVKERDKKNTVMASVGLILGLLAIGIVLIHFFYNPDVS